MGKVILQCKVCKSDVFEDKDNLVIDEDENVCLDTECPYCMSNEGYTIIGQVSPFKEGVEFEEPEIDEPEVEEPEIDVEDDVDIDDEAMEEGFKRKPYDKSRKNESLKESLVATNIKWDTSDEEYDNSDLSLPTEVRIPQGIVDEDEISDWLSDKYGFCHFGFDLISESLEEGISLKPVDRLKRSDRIKGQKELKGVDKVKGVKDLKGEKPLDESIEDVSVTTEDETMTMTTKEDGGVVIETSPKEEEEAEVISDEMIAPIPEEEQDEIIDTATEEPEAEEDMFSDEEFEDELPFDEFDEESFDGLGESYLRRCYENVNAFKTSNVSVEGNKLIVEGKITFDSGNEKNTKFVFESVKNKNGKVRFTGLNEQISKGKKSFKLNCSLDNTKLVCESLNYNYKSKNELDESVRVYGTVRK